MIDGMDDLKIATEQMAERIQISIHLPVYYYTVDVAWLSEEAARYIYEALDCHSISYEKYPSLVSFEIATYKDVDRFTAYFTEVCLEAVAAVS